MKNQLLKITSVVLLVWTAFACTSQPVSVKAETTEKRKIVSLNGTITEIIYALGAGDEVVAVDVTSTFPSETVKLTNLGHLSSISAESILGSAPTHVIGFKDEVKPELMQQLQQAGVEVVLYEREFSVKGAQQVIQKVASWLDRTEIGQQLVASIDTDVKSLRVLENKPTVLFVYARGAGMMMVAGEDTQLEKMIEIAGGKNAVSGFQEFKPLTPEAVIEANPSLVLMFESGAQSISKAGGFQGIPGIKLTNAGKNNQVLEMDGLFLSGFGPRMGKALLELNQKLASLNV